MATCMCIRSFFGHIHHVCWHTELYLVHFVVGTTQSHSCGFSSMQCSHQTASKTDGQLSNCDLACMWQTILTTDCHSVTGYLPLPPLPHTVCDWLNSHDGSLSLVVWGWEGWPLVLLRICWWGLYKYFFTKNAIRARYRCVHGACYTRTWGICVKIW